MRLIPRVRPRPFFRIRVLLYTHLPSLGAHLATKNEASIIERRVLGTQAAVRPPALRLSFARVLATVAVIAVIAFGSFGALSLAARNSMPGDILYSVKRAREDLELALTMDKSKRLKKNLTLAEARLAELDQLLSGSPVEARNIELAVQDYRERTTAVEDVLSKNGQLEEARGFAEDLRALRNAEMSIEKRLTAASAHAVLAPASGARVTFVDIDGRLSVNERNMFKTTVASDGVTSFKGANLEGGGADRIEVTIELDGRCEVMPLLRNDYSAKPGGPLSCSITPGVSSLLLNEPQRFTLSLSTCDGRSTAGRKVRLSDVSRTSLINGEAAGVTLLTDSEGRCEFAVTKHSLARVSRISAKVLDGLPQDLGEVIVLGGLKVAQVDSVNSGVITRVSGPSSGPQNIEFDNGVIRLSTGTSTKPGTVISSLSDTGSGESVGPLFDPLASGCHLPSDVTTEGPKLVFSGADAAGYEVSFNVPVGETVVRKTYLVSLKRGNSFATVECTVQIDGNEIEPLDERPLSDVMELALPQECKAFVADRPVAFSGANATLLNFDVSAPYVVLKRNTHEAIMACSLSSAAYPIAWVFEDGGLALRLGPDSLSGGFNEKVTAFIGVSDEAGIGELKDTAFWGIGGVSEPSGNGSDSTDGFAIEVSPALEQVSRNEQEVSIRVYKLYEKLIGR